MIPQQNVVVDPDAMLQEAMQKLGIEGARSIFLAGQLGAAMKQIAALEQTVAEMTVNQKVKKVEG